MGGQIYIHIQYDKWLEKGGVGGLGMGGQRYNWEWEGHVDKSMMVKGWLGGLGMGGQRHMI